jgi:hypothetical protein
VAVTPAYLNPANWDVAYYELGDRVQPSSSSYRVLCGDDICIVGLFHWHSGQERNVPIVHSGAIALLPDPDEKVLIKNRATGNAERVEVYLVEALTFEGLSGAPVFHREPVALRTFPEHNGGPVLAPTGAQLLGVYSGAWDGPPSELLRVDRNWETGRRIPAGMGLVVPAERIVETIKSNEQLKKHRADIVRKNEQKLPPRPAPLFPHLLTPIRQKFEDARRILTRDEPRGASPPTSPSCRICCAVRRRRDEVAAAHSRCPRHRFLLEADIALSARNERGRKQMQPSCQGAATVTVSSMIFAWSPSRTRIAV